MTLPTSSLWYSGVVVPGVQVRTGSKRCLDDSHAGYALPLGNQIKGLKNDEAHFLMGILPDYVSHMQTHPSSLLPVFCALVRVSVGGESVYVVVMPNLFAGREVGYRCVHWATAACHCYH